MLLDFGAARITLSEEAMKLKPMYTAGFAAPEHYRFKPEELGPWSDIYSVGATMYTCIAGTPPQAGDQREEKDRMIPSAQLARQKYSDDLYDIVDSCLQLDWLKRPQTAFDLQKRLMEEPRPREKQQLLRHHQQAALEALLALKRSRSCASPSSRTARSATARATRTASATRTAATCC